MQRLFFRVNIRLIDDTYENKIPFWLFLFETKRLLKTDFNIYKEPTFFVVTSSSVKARALAHTSLILSGMLSAQVIISRPASLDQCTLSLSWA